MNLNIKNKTPDTVEIQGQVVTIAFAEGAMLAGLVASCGRNETAQCHIVGQYMDAGLSAAAFPSVARTVAAHRKAAEQETLRRQAEAQAHAERVASYQTPGALQVARRRAAREERERKHREMGAAVRAANGRSTWRSADHFE